MSRSTISTRSSEHDSFINVSLSKNTESPLALSAQHRQRDSSQISYHHPHKLISKSKSHGDLREIMRLVSNYPRGDSGLLLHDKKGHEINNNVAFNTCTLIKTHDVVHNNTSLDDEYTFTDTLNEMIGITNDDHTDEDEDEEDISFNHFIKECTESFQSPEKLKRTATFDVSIRASALRKSKSINDLKSLAKNSSSKPAYKLKAFFRNIFSNTKFY